MYSPVQRNTYFKRTIEKLQSSRLVEGIIQLGSGVVGYTDEFSDIDLMVSSSNIEEVKATKEFVRTCLNEFQPIYIKEKQLGENIYLFIVLLKNKLELNVSVVPRNLLSVRSPLWKIVVDKTGKIAEKMNQENERFLKKSVKNNLSIDVPFEFTYCLMSLEKELNRNNVIYALQMLDLMREYTVLVQAMNEGKKIHQFKAYHTLNPAFIQLYLETFPKDVLPTDILESSLKLKELFKKTVCESKDLSIDHDLENLLCI